MVLHWPKSLNNRNLSLNLIESCGESRASLPSKSKCKRFNTIIFVSSLAGLKRDSFLTKISLDRIENR